MPPSGATPAAGRLRRLLTTLMKEGLAPREAAAAVFVGVVVGIVPIYGFQSLVAITLAVLLKLNKPLTFAATFINNPLLQPLLVFSSVELGHLMLKGSFLPLSPAALRATDLGSQLAVWLTGSLVLAAVVGSAAALLTYAVLRWRCSAGRRKPWREWLRWVDALYSRSPRFDRGFVRWKTRLDRIFPLLLEEDLGEGRVVDLGCGYGAALALAAYRDRGRQLIGCDLAERRIEAARRALAPFAPQLSVCDMRAFQTPHAGLILLIDVLQYLAPAEQVRLLESCSRALAPRGKLILRVHDAGRGLLTRLTQGLDRALFRLEGGGLRPVWLPVEEYHQVLERAGLAVRERPFRNRLPLVHVMLVAERPPAESAA